MFDISPGILGAGCRRKSRTEQKTSGVVEAGWLDQNQNQEGILGL